MSSLLGKVENFGKNVFDHTVPGVLMKSFQEVQHLPNSVSLAEKKAAETIKNIYHGVPNIEHQIEQRVSEVSGVILKDAKNIAGGVGETVGHLTGGIASGAASEVYQNSPYMIPIMAGAGILALLLFLKL